MNFIDLNFGGLYGISPKLHRDERGNFFRVYEDLAFPISFTLVEASVATNSKVNTLRGMHFQEEEYAENKVVLCVDGYIQDVVIDLRPQSPNYMKWKSIHLGLDSEYFGLFIPKGFAHGYLTKADDSRLLYFMDTKHNPNAAKGIRWNDKSIGINWDAKPDVISNKDTSWPLLRHQ